jgi:3-oxoacyl-[acyl-carrier protein] reductase
MFNLSGKSALVTGATGGLGSEIAKVLHANGAQVVISGTRESILNELKEELKERVHAVTANLSDANSVIELYKKAEEVCSKIDILVCNAGITRDNLMIRMLDNEFDEVINVNLKAVFLLNREAMKAMIKRRSGRIINISSIVGETGNFGQTNYAAAKAGIIGMSKSAALEGASRGVTVNCIAPGFIDTPMTSVIKDEIKEKIKQKIPAADFGTPKDIAAGCLYLASDEARYVTGAVLNINGGMYM